MKIDESVKFLKGVGPYRYGLLNNLGIYTALDLMEYFPRTYINRISNVKIADLEIDTVVALVGRIVDVQELTSASKKKRLQAQLFDGEDVITLTWFQYNKWISKTIFTGAELWVSGKVQAFNGHLNITHPEVESSTHIDKNAEFWKNRPLLPIYKLTGNLNNNLLRNIMVNCFSECASQVRENLPDKLIKKHDLIERSKAIQIVHFGTKMDLIEVAKKRFSFEEFFYTQILLARTRFRQKKIVQGKEFQLKKTYTSKLRSSIPYRLTQAQTRVINEIISDMQSSKQMNRLVQGDVGSGKTIVSLFAMLLAVENGYQAILMAPTEILAEQHVSTISSYLKDQPDIKIALLKGGNYKGKKQVKEDIKEGNFQIIVGTHALIQKDVIYNNPGIMVIDEQHRFGVEQRAKLSQKMDSPDMLYLSATPIPRSLAMTVYGDLDVSQIDELPPTRKKVTTIWHGVSKKKIVFDKILSQLELGHQVYVVCPLVEESEKIDLRDAESTYEYLSKEVYPNYRVALLHGKMHSKDKDEIMRDFKLHNYDILVSTTVIEVGVDVPNATVMMIEHAERFGLSTIHQLRGRVGRGSEEAFCYLISYPPISNEGRERLSTMVATSNGFEIAEKDLELRGPGDFFGKEQSGLPRFKFANIITEQSLLKIAREEAFKLVERDPHLENEENRLVKNFYYKSYFEREQLIRY